MIQLKQLSLRRGQRLLLDKADLTIYAKQKIGIVGLNGSGKSSLFKLLLGELNLDSGDLLLPKNSTWAHIQQAMPQSSDPALDYVLQGDHEYYSLMTDLRRAERDAEGLKIANIHARMNEIDGYAAPSKAAKILLGLGFSQNDLEKPVKTFSGGWRMRLNLAQVLMSRADILLLDEPTNHLDLETIMWLEIWLKKSSATILLISHDRDFLDAVIKHTVHLDQQQLKLYTGNYSAFEKARAEQLAIQKASYKKQQQRREHLQSFIDRFRAKATKAKQAQSRLKMLEKMESVSSVHLFNPFRFHFKPIQKVGTPMLQLRHANIGYDNKEILNNVTVGLSDGDRIGLIGPNGAGKSTLIKVFAQILKLQSGEFIASNKIKVGYFDQHQLEQLTPEASPFDHLREIDPKITDSEARRYLGSFNFSNDDVFRAVQGFSGGEKARLVLALIIWQAPNLLLLDEPTNHLDMEMREALNEALQEYQGALVIVSHDRHLLNSVSNEFWLVADGQVSRFDGDIDDYHRWFDNYSSQDKLPYETKPKSPNKNKLTKQLTKLENELLAKKNDLKEIETLLSDHTIYNPDNKNKLKELSANHKNLIKKINILENEIIDLMQRLDS